MAGRERPAGAPAVAASKVGEIMTTPVITVLPHTPTAEIAQQLRHHRFSGLPVLDEAGAVVGLVSEYDLLAKPGRTAREVMTTSVITVTEDTAIDDVRHLLVERRIRRVPVLSGGHLVGIVSRGDIVALLATEWVCVVCGEPVRGERPPEVCPKCKGSGDRFILQEQPPGT